MLPAIYLHSIRITPVNPTHPFELPPSGDTVIDFVNELGSFTGKTSGSDKHSRHHPFCQILWENVHSKTNVDHAELLWEEFTQGIQTFFSHKASHKASLKNPKTNNSLSSFPYGFFQIFYIGNLKVVPLKVSQMKSLEWQSLFPLITEADSTILVISQDTVKWVAENTKKTPQESASVQPATKHATTKKPTTTTPVKQSKPAPPPTKKPSKCNLPQKVRKGKPTFQLVDEDDEAQQESIPQEEGDEP
ncbi:hypothetical protein Tco_0238466 [Tanacetum coccineum]